jgi:hypothetical protein
MSELPLSIAALGEDYISLWREFSIFPTRAEVFQRTRLFKPRTLANLDCQGRGPAGRLNIGGRICYPREQVVLWFAGQVKPLTKKGLIAGQPKTRSHSDPLGVRPLPAILPKEE